MTKRKLFFCISLLLVIFCINVSIVGAEEVNSGYLAYKEPQAASQSASTISTVAYVFSLLVTFVIVIGLAFLTSRFIGTKFGQSSQKESAKVLCTIPFGQNKAVHMVQIANRILILGVTDHNINLLQEISSPQEVAEITSQIIADVSESHSNEIGDVFGRHIESLQQMSKKFLEKR